MEAWPALWPAAPESSRPAPGDAGPFDEDLIWASHSASPGPAAAPVVDLPECRLHSTGLREVALHVARRRARGDDLPDSFELVTRLRAAGVPHVWPRAWALATDAADVATLEPRLRAWLARQTFAGEPRCGVARARRGDREALAVVLVDAAADLSPLPTSARLGQWLRLEARLLDAGDGSLEGAGAGDRVVLLGPNGPPRSLTLHRSAGQTRLRSAFSLDRPGRWRVQVVSDGPLGPRPVLESWVFVDQPPDPRPRLDPAPGEALAAAEPAADGGRAALLAMLNAARRGQGLPPLRPDPRLNRLAQAHAERMQAVRWTAHDVGDGTPDQRLRRAGLRVARLGENVARAASVALAHRALWDSPSHRGNVLSRTYRAGGLGIAPGVSVPGLVAPPSWGAPGGEVWVCQLFVD
jgi:hypothetical protein